MNALFPFHATTRDVTVHVAVSFLPEQSEPDRGRWFWAYHIRIENGGAESVQLMTRHWRITDGRGTISHIDGDGVVGFDGIPEALPGGGLRGECDRCDEGG